MPAKAKKKPMTNEQIMDMVQTKKMGQNVGKAAEWREANDAEISKILAMSLSGLYNVAEPQENISLNDTEAIKQITMRYMKACFSQSMIPSMTDIASSLGCTRAAIYFFMQQHPDHPSTAWFRHLSDVFGDVLAKAALSGATAGIPSIFVLKAKFGWREDADEMPRDDKSNDHMDADTIMDKYQDLPDD